MNMQSQRIIKKVIEELCKKINGLEGIYLFGSRAEDKHYNNSDWDFAFLCRISVTQDKLYNIKADLEMELNIDLDIVDLYTSNTLIQVQVIKTGKLVWINNIYNIEQFEYLTLSYYQKLNEERKEILKDIKSRGNVYG